MPLGVFSHSPCYTGLVVALKHYVVGSLLSFPMLYWELAARTPKTRWKSSLIPRVILGGGIKDAFEKLEVISHSPCYTGVSPYLCVGEVGSHLSFPMLYWGIPILCCNNADKPGFSV